MAMVLRDLVHELDPRLQQRTRLRRVGGLAILDWWLTTTGALALVPLMSSVEDLLWSWVLFAFVLCGIWGTTDTELGSVSSFAGNFASAAAADILVNRLLVSDGDFGVVFGLKLALLSSFFSLPKLYWIPLGCRVIDVGIDRAPDFLLSAVRLQIFLTFITILYDARHSIVLVVSRCALRALRALDGFLELNQENACQSFSKIFPYCSLYLIARLLWCGYINWNVDNVNGDNVIVATVTDAVFDSPLGHVGLASVLAAASSATTLSFGENDLPPVLKFAVSEFFSVILALIYLGPAGDRMFAINQATGLVLAGTARTVADAASVATVRPSLCIIATLASLHSALSLSLTPAKDVSVADFVSATVSAVALLESADALLRLTLRSRTTGSLAWKVGFLLLQLPAAMPLIELLVIFVVLGPLSARLYAGERGLLEKPHFGANLSLLSLHALIMTWSRATDAWEKAAARWRAANLVSYKLGCPTEEEILAYDDNCGICRDGLEWSPGTRKTLCGHMFHAECLVRWFTISRTCPMCHSAPM